MDPVVVFGFFVFLSAVVYSVSAFFSRPLLDAYYGLLARLTRVFVAGDKIFVYDEKNKIDLNGYVESTGVFSTRLRDDSNRRYLLPNSRLYELPIKIQGPAEASIRDFFDFDLRYHQDLDKVKQIMLEEGEKFSSRMAPGTKREFKLVAVRPDFMQVRLYYWAKVKDVVFLSSDLKEAVMKRFLAEGVNLGVLQKPKDGYT